MFSGRVSWKVVLKVAGCSKISIFETSMPITKCFIAQVFIFLCIPIHFRLPHVSMCFSNYGSNSIHCLLKYVKSEKLIFIEIPLYFWQHEKVM